MAGGKGCAQLAAGLPGYPGALAVEEDGTVSVGYRWACSAWLEDHADGTLLRGAALRLSESMGERLFQMPDDGICAERFGPDGAAACLLRRQGAGRCPCPLPGGEPGVSGRGR